MAAGRDKAAHLLDSSFVAAVDNPVHRVDRAVVSPGEVDSTVVVVEAAESLKTRYLTYLYAPTRTLSR
jgi:hypothetical protein